MPTEKEVYQKSKINHFVHTLCAVCLYKPSLCVIQLACKIDVFKQNYTVGVYL